MMEKIKAFVSENPYVFGIFFFALGVAGLLAAILDWDWLFAKDLNRNTYTLKKIDGWVNLLGRRNARIAVGAGSVFVILFGAFWFWAYAFYYKH